MGDADERVIQYVRLGYAVRVHRLDQVTGLDMRTGRRTGRMVCGAAGMIREDGVNEGPRCETCFPPLIRSGRAKA